MKYSVKYLAGILALLFLLFGCAPPSDMVWKEIYDSGNAAVADIAYVPLDDRPINTTRVEWLAQSAGFRLLMPENSLYRTALDGRPANPNGSPCGDGEALLAWLEGCEADYYVVSMDQILSGGLVHSRWMTEITEEYKRIDRLLAGLAGKQVILYDTVMRLAPTVGYHGTTEKDYQALRAYGSLPREKPKGELTAEKVIEAYEVPTDLEPTLVLPYLAARGRKLQLCEYLLQALADRPEITVFYGIDDSHPSNTIQTGEIALIQQELTNGQIFSGTDEMGLLAIAAVIRSHYGEDQGPTVGIQYFGVDAQKPADEYDVGSLQETLFSHISALHLDIDQEQYDVELLVLGDQEASEGIDEVSRLLAHYQKNLRRRVPTILIDLRADFCFAENMLTDPNMDFSCLLSYSGWNTAGNAIGVALSNGIARYLYLKYEAVPIVGANSAFLCGLALSFVKDVSYAQAKPQIENYIRRLGYDAGNFYMDSSDLKDLCGRALALLHKSKLSPERFFTFMKGKQFLTSLTPYQSEEIPVLYISDIIFPWYRTYEAEIVIRIKH